MNLSVLLFRKGRKVASCCHGEESEYKEREITVKLKHTSIHDTTLFTDSQNMLY